MDKDKNKVRESKRNKGMERPVLLLCRQENKLSQGEKVDRARAGRPCQAIGRIFYLYARRNGKLLKCLKQERRFHLIHALKFLWRQCREWVGVDNYSEFNQE